MSERANKAAEGEEALLKDAPLLVVVVGPTGSGKSALAVRLAERGFLPGDFLPGDSQGSGSRGQSRSRARMLGEVVSCDSVAVYREMEIGTAKPRAEERARVPHHCWMWLSGRRRLRAGDYAGRRGRRWRRFRRGDWCRLWRAEQGFICGRCWRVCLRVREEGGAAGAARETAARRGVDMCIGCYGGWIRRRRERSIANDVPKVVRAIEVTLAAGRPLTEAWAAGREGLRGFRVVKLGLAPERERLYERINQRAVAMFERGLVEETRGLVEVWGGVPGAGVAWVRAGSGGVAGGDDGGRGGGGAAQGHRNLCEAAGDVVSAGGGSGVVAGIWG